MKTKFQRLIFLAAMFLIAPFHFSEVASSDPPPAILGLDEDYIPQPILKMAWFGQEKYGNYQAKNQWCTRRILLSI